MVIEKRCIPICTTDLNLYEIFVRAINDDDLQKLTQIQMIRIPDTRFKT
jgi:hypothetical protein